MVVTGGEGKWEEDKEDKRDPIYGDGRTLGFG